MTELVFGPWQATVAEECGSNLISLKYMGKQILRSPEDLATLKGRPCLYGFPLLLPANRVADGMFSFAGNSYTLSINEPGLHNHIHGLIKDAPFKVLEQKENYIKTVLENNGEFYPFSFVLKIEDTLDDCGWTRHLTLENPGRSAMPYTLGFHTAFLEPQYFCVPISKRCEMNDRFVPTGVLLPLSEQQMKWKAGTAPDGGKINGCYISSGGTVQVDDFAMTVSKQFDHWVLFNGNGGEGYLCIEPQCGAVNGLNSGKHRLLLPGEKESFTINIQLHDTTI